MNKRGWLSPFSVAVYLLVAACMLTDGRAQISAGKDTRAVDGDSFIRNWLVCGPFPNPPREGQEFYDHEPPCVGLDTDYLTEHGGETGIRPKVGMLHRRPVDTPVMWQRYASPWDVLKLSRPFKGESRANVVAYAFTTIGRPRAENMFVAAGSDDGIKMWLNGELVHENLVGRGIRADEDVVAVSMRKGENNLLVKVEQGGGSWGFCLRVVSEKEGVALAAASALNAAELEYRPVFTGKDFPSFALDVPEPMRVAVGSVVLRTTIYDRKYAEVQNAEAPGRYGAVVELIPEIGEPARRYATLFRQAEQVEWWRQEWKLFSETLPPGLGIDPAVVRAQQETLADYMKWRLVDGLAKDPTAAVLLAGLFEMRADEPPAAERTSAWARDRDWWLRLRHKRGELSTSHLLDLPVDYTQDETRQWPLLLFLHGRGARGDDLKMVSNHGPPKLIREGRQLPFIVVSPLCPAGISWQPVELGMLLDKIEAEYRVDPERIYVTGLSMGGYGTWALAMEYPERFAAIAPICGGGDARDVARIKDIPIWIFHGARDTSIPIERSQAMVDALETLGAEPRFTVYPRAGHDSWTETYDNPALYEWFLEHKRRARR